MESILKLIKEKKYAHPVITDGAMGTYYASRLGTCRCEDALLTSPELIEQIHREYIAAGARLIRTNSFETNTYALDLGLRDVLRLCRLSYETARRAAGDSAVVAADIGPIYPDDELSARRQYSRIIDEFLSAGAKVFCMETFPSTEDVRFCARLIKEKRPDAEIIAMFTFTPDGYTHMGLSVESIFEQAARIEELDIVGLNCGCGPTHMRRLLPRVPEIGKPLAFLPNAGYPSVENGTTVFSAGADYFASVSAKAVRGDIALIGGCCGTTPAHISALSRSLSTMRERGAVSASPGRRAAEQAICDGMLARKLERGEFTILAEVDPPVSSDCADMLRDAEILSNGGTNIITVSDSPMARVKLDSVAAAAKISRDCGAQVLPHICCRDRNSNALRSALLAAHCEGIRSVLAVTGDPVAESDRGFVKPVFNLTSQRLIKLISDMNREQFASSPILIGGALDPMVKNKDVELERVKRKMEAGASFFLTQPIFSLESMELIDRVRALGAKVFGGIIPLINLRNAQYMSSEVPGMSIPPEVVSRFSADMTREEANETGAQIALSIACEVRAGLDGFYFITPKNRAEVITSIIDALRKRGVI